MSEDRKHEPAYGRGFKSHSSLLFGKDAPCVTPYAASEVFLCVTCSTTSSSSIRRNGFDSFGMPARLIAMPRKSGAVLPPDEDIRPDIAISFMCGAMALN